MSCESDVIEPLEFTPDEVAKVYRAMAGVELLDVCLSLSGKRMQESCAEGASFSTEEYSQAALLCLKDGEQQLVEDYFIELGLVDVTALYRELGNVSVRGKREETIVARAKVTLAGNKAVINQSNANQKKREDLKLKL